MRKVKADWERMEALAHKLGQGPAASAAVSAVQQFSSQGGGERPHKGDVTNVAAPEAQPLPRERQRRPRMTAL